MALVLGKDGMAYRNTGTTETPVWDEVDNLVDVVLDMAKDEADVTARNSGGWKLRKGTLKNGNVESEMIYDTEDTDFTAIQTAFFANSTMEFAFMDGPIATSGSQGLKATFDIGNFGRKEELANAMRVPLALWTTHGTTPAWYIVA